MNLYAKAYWSNNPIPVNQQINNPDFIINVPIGVIVSEGGDVKSVNGKIGVVVLDSADVGAPSLTYVNEQLDTKADSIAVTQALSTKADLVGGLIPANQLPSSVDDVLEYASLSSFPVEGEASKIYVALDTNKTYRWGGSSYVEIGGGGVTLGETSSTAHRGDHGKAAYDHSVSTGNPHNSTTSDIPEGTRFYFTEERVRLTPLVGLVLQNSAVVSTDSIVNAIGKLQGQVNTKTSLSLGEGSTDAYRGDRGKVAYDHSQSQGNPHNTTTSDISEGTNKYFTETRVGQTVLTGLNTNTATPALATDQLLAAIGKLQAQINNIAPPVWVSAASIGTVHPSIVPANNFIEFAKINGMLWIRGFFKNTGPILYESQPHFFLITDNSYKIIQRIAPPSLLINIPIKSIRNVNATIAFLTNGKCIDASTTSTSNQYFSIMGTTLSAPSDFYYIPPTCLGELVIK